MKLSGKKREENLWYLELGKEFLELTSKAPSIERKMDKLNLLKMKDPTMEIKRQDTELKQICKPHI